MPVVYSVAAQNARLQAVVTTIDAGSAAGVIRLLDTNGVILSTLPLAKPSATVANGVITFIGVPLTDLSAANNGLCVSARIEDSNGTTVISGLTVGTGGGFDFLLSPTATISVGQSVALQTGTITGN